MAWRRGQAYSQDLRDRVLAADGSAREVAARLQVSVSYAVKVRQRRDRFGETTARAQRSHTPRRLAPWHDDIAAHLRAHPDATMAELREWLFATHGVRVSMGLIWNTLDRLGLTLKKTLARGRTGPGRHRRSAPPIPRAAAKTRPGALGVFG